MLNVSLDQYAAVSHDGGHALVVAGPGSGKTRVIAARVQWLLEHGTPASNIILLSFTRASAAEMANRLKAMGIEGVTCSTIHALALDILRREGGRLGYADASKLVVRTDAEMADLAEQAITALAFDPFKITAKNVVKSLTEPVELKNQTTIESIRRSADKLKRMLLEGNGIGYRQIVPWASIVITTTGHRPYSVVPGLAESPIHFAVDEGQDLSHDQWCFLRNLDRGEDVRLFVVGDVDQAIYGWRGADPEQFLAFAQTATTYRLEDNHRSDTAICDAANNLIRHNEHRVKEQRTRAVSTAAGEVSIWDHPNDLDDEALIITKSIAQRLNDGSIAILSPTHARLDAVEAELTKAGIPCYRLTRQANDEAFTRALDLLRLITRPDDDYLARRCVKAAFPDLADTEISKTAASAAGKNIPLIHELAVCGHDVGAWARAVIIEGSHNPISPLTMSFFGYEKSRADLSVLTSLFEEWSVLNNSSDIRAFIHDLESGEFQPGNVAVASGEGVALATIYAAKGLEWDVVFVLGLEEGTLPRKSGSLEEMRRLCFVAVTRARHTVILSRCRVIPERNDALREAEPSRFLAEINSQSEIVREI